MAVTYVTYVRMLISFALISKLTSITDRDYEARTHP